MAMAYDCPSCELVAASDGWFARAEYHLLGWGIWRRTGGDSTTRGYDSHSTVLSTGGSSATFDHLVQLEDDKAGAICDRIIDDLPYLYRVALESEYVMQGVVKHNRLATAELLADAQTAFWCRARRVLI